MENKQYNAVCSTCNNACTVPFMPKSGQPITCKTCWKATKTIPTTNINVEQATTKINSSSFNSLKDNLIIAQTLTKCASEIYQPNGVDTPTFNDCCTLVYDGYKLLLGLVERNE